MVLPSNAPQLRGGKASRGTDRIIIDRPRPLERGGAIITIPSRNMHHIEYQLDDNHFPGGGS